MHMVGSCSTLVYMVYTVHTVGSCSTLIYILNTVHTMGSCCILVYNNMVHTVQKVQLVHVVQCKLVCMIGTYCTYSGFMLNFSIQ